MTRALTWLPALAVCFLASSASADTGTSTLTRLRTSSTQTSTKSPFSSVVLRGAKALPEPVYRALLESSGEKPSAAPRVLAAQLEQFLQKAGYELARVRGRTDDGKTVLEIEEGELDKIVLLNSGTGQAISFRLELNLPHNVFNRIFLEQQLETLAKRFKADSYQYKLVPVSADQGDEDVPFFLKEVERIQILKHRTGDYELHVSFEQKDFHRGLEFGVGIGFPDGLSLSLGYADDSLIWDDDRWLLRGTLATRLDRFPSRAIALARYSTPEVILEGFRPTLEFKVDLIDRQRPDLNLERYYFLTLTPRLGLTQEIGKVAEFYAGFGAESRFLFDVVPIVDSVYIPRQDPATDLRALWSLGVKLRLEPGQVRRDREQVLDLELEQYLPAGGQDVVTKGFLRHRKVFMFGRNELWITNAGALIGGDVAFTDEEPLGGRYLRGVFADKYYTQAVINLGLEYRYSIFRDIYKISAYHDGVLFRETDRLTTSDRLSAANAFGVGFHALIFDMLQLNVYWGLGLDRFGVDNGFSANLVQAL